MEKIKNHLRDDYHLSNYQIAQLEYLLKTIFSEISKIVIMGILFHNRLGLYVFALIVMIFLRSTTGGLHFYTYLQCLLASTLYIGCAIFILPDIKLPSYIQTLIMITCLLLCYYIGPVVSKYRPNPTQQSFDRFRNMTCMFIFFFAIVLNIIPDYPFMLVGFWIVILHSLQLIVAKIRKKGELQNA